ncbi:zincin [Serendipita vermifera]|nr:zincin [Serendipita vermifera]
MFIAFSLLLAAGSAFAAPYNATLPYRGCGAHKDAAAIQADEARFRSDLASINSIQDVSALASGPVPVVWHVISKSDAPTGGNVPDSQIKAQIDAMNDHYKSTGLSFELTKTTRTKNAAWFSGVGPDESSQTDMKKQLREGDEGTLNIYSVGFESGSGQGLLGYATFPSDYKGNPKDDGVVLLYSSLPGGSSTNYDEGKTLTHEVGHWLGLYHVFQGGCDVEGDMVSDTPPQQTATSGCPTTQDSCPGGGVDSVHNFMDYSYDSCMDSFTAGQITRFKQQILTYRQISVGGGTVSEVPTTSDEPTVDPTDTETVVPTDTEAPVPTDTEVPVPTDTEVPVPTDTEDPIPSDTEEPIPTDTEEPFPSDTEDPFPFPSDTEDPLPTDSEDPFPTEDPTDVPIPTATRSQTKTRTRTRTTTFKAEPTGDSNCPSWWSTYFPEFPCPF